MEYFNTLRTHSQNNFISHPSASTAILVIENSPLIQKIYRIMLESLGYQVVIAPTGIEAIRLFNNSFFLVFMNISLPDISGIQVAERIRQHPYGITIPIIANLSISDEQIFYECLLAGINEIFNKFFTFTQLSLLVNRYLKKIDTDNTFQIY